MPVRLLALVMLLLVPTTPTHAQDVITYKADPGPWRVEVIEETWRDASRTTDGKPREVPVRVYMPVADGPPAEEAAPVKFPVVVFSHGLGGSREGYEYIGRHLASHGYLMIHPQHAGSDTHALRELARVRDDGAGLRERRRAGRMARLLDDGTSDPDNLVNRPLDIRFALDEVARHPNLGAFADMDRVAVAGHSFGSYTAMAVAGMIVHLPETHGGPVRSFRDARVKVAISMSPQGPGVMGVDENGWGKIGVPVLLMTGSKDMGQGDRAVSWRLTPFEKLSNRATRLLYIDEATHATFSGANSLMGMLKGGPRETVDRHVGFIRQTCTAYLDAHLRDDAGAKQWIAAKQIEKASKGECELRLR